jgi:hypothetical protein
MNKQERGLFYSQMDNILPIMSEVDQRKIEFVKTFLERRFKVDEFENSFINIDRMGTKSLMYLLFVLLIEYDTKMKV